MICYHRPIFFGMIKSKRMRWTEHVERMMAIRPIYKVLVGKPEAQSPLGRPSRRWEIILRYIFRKCDVGNVGLDRAG
jgi:hypothetical protein